MSAGSSKGRTQKVRPIAPINPRSRLLVNTSLGLLHVRFSGTGTAGPIVLLHQISSSSRMFLRLMDELGQRGWASLAIDLPGFGFSDPAPAGATVEQLAKAVADGLEDLGYHGALPFLGHHTGARVAATLAADMPQRASHLVLIGLPLYPTPAAREARFAVKKVQKIAPERSGRYLLHEWTRLTELSPNTAPALIHREFVDTVLANAYDESYEMVRQHDLHRVAGLIRCPTLLVRPGFDTQAQNQNYAVQVIPGAQLATVDGGVFVVDENPGAIADLAAAFLGGAH